MKPTLKLNSLSFMMLTLLFAVFSCNQAKESDETHDETKTENAKKDKQSLESTEDKKAQKEFESTTDEESASILDAYLDLKDALVASSVDLAKSSAEKIKTTLTDKETSGALQSILANASQISASSDVEQMRNHFDLMSQNVYTMVKVKNSGQTVYKQYCPMAFNNEGAFWLSLDENIKNPYFGDKMLKCGKVQETIQGSK